MPTSRLLNDNRVKDISGQQFNHWTAVRWVKNAKSRATRWLYRCVCGTEKVLYAETVRRGISRSCGCRRSERAPVLTPPAPKIAVAEKRCNKCQALKPALTFSPQPRTPDGLMRTCKECRNEYFRLRRADPVAARASVEAVRRYRAKESARDILLRRQYGITITDYRTLKEKQGGRCAICSKPAEGEWSLCVDHDHSTGAIRGLLCLHCNKGLGQFGDTIEGLMRAVRYLQSAAGGRHPFDHAV